MRTRLLTLFLVLIAGVTTTSCVMPSMVGQVIVPFPLIAGSAPSVSVSGDAHVPEGKIHQGDLVVIMGDARVEGTVTGQIVVVLGSLEMTGTANDQVVSILTDTRIGDTARIHGDLVNVGWLLDRADGSRVDGEVINVSFMHFIPFVHHGEGWAGLLWIVFIIKLASLALFFLAILLVTALVPRRLEVIASAFPEKWAWALLTGLLVYAGIFVACFVLFCTVIGIPLAGALIVATKVIKWLGLASIFLLVGQSAGRNLFKRELSHLPAVLGGFAVYSILWLVPFVGWPFVQVLDILAVGIVVMTRFGSEEPWGHNRLAAPAAPPGAATPSSPAAGGPSGPPEPPPVVPAGRPAAAP